MSVNKSRTFSESTGELSYDPDNIILNVKANEKIANIRKRFNEVAKRIIRNVERIKGSFSFTPVVVYESVDSTEGALENIDSNVQGYFVKSFVRNGNLIITDVSPSYAHSGGVGSINFQAETWSRANGSRFDILRNANIAFGPKLFGAPDMSITTQYFYRPVGQAVVELETSRRGIAGMRRDFLSYFAETTLLSVVGIKFFESLEGNCAVLHAAAVQWSRDAAGDIVVTAVRDFGVLPLSNSMKQSFAEELNDALPAVPQAMWEANRHIPVVLSDIHPPPLGGNFTPAVAVEFIAHPDNGGALFSTTGAPTMT